RRSRSSQGGGQEIWGSRRSSQGGGQEIWGSRRSSQGGGQEIWGSRRSNQGGGQEIWGSRRSSQGGGQEIWGSRRSSQGGGQEIWGSRRSSQGGKQEMKDGLPPSTSPGWRGPMGSPKPGLQHPGYGGGAGGMGGMGGSGAGMGSRAGEPYRLATHESHTAPRQAAPGAGPGVGPGGQSPGQHASRRSLQVDFQGSRTGRSPSASPDRGGVTPTSPYSVPQIAPMPSSKLCPVCTTTELTNPPAVPNYNTCTQCKSTVCNQCGFNPNPHLTKYVGV
ncbi:hypothetical protein CRUP_003984, partial [Coryphaenoides rupestris]